MFLDRAIHIIGNISPDYQPILSLAIHGLGINIIAFFLILNQPTFFLKIIEIGGGLQVNSRIMLIRPFWEIDFRFNDMVKGFLVSFRFRTSFLRVQYVIGTGSHLLYKFFWRTNSLERFYFCHGN
jgi:hypothetical protein